MILMIVTYAGDAGARFDRDYYIDVHLPLVRKVWGPSGLESVAGFFPPSGGAGVIAVALCRFRNEAAVKAAFASPQTEAVMADVAAFTDIKPTRWRAAEI